MLPNVLVKWSLFSCRLAENEIEEDPAYDFTGLTLDTPSTPTEQNLHQRYQLFAAPLALRTSEIPVAPANTTVTVAASEPAATSADQVTLSVLSADIEQAMQRTLDTWRNEAMPAHNQPMIFNPDDDYLLADILQRSENEQQNLFLRCLGIDLLP